MQERVAEETNLYQPGSMADVVQCAPSSLVPQTTTHDALDLPDLSE